MGACCMYKLLACVETKQLTNCGYNNALKRLRSAVWQLRCAMLFSSCGAPLVEAAAAQCCLAAAVRSAV